MPSLGTKFAILCLYFVTAAIGSSQVASFPSNSDWGGGAPYSLCYLQCRLVPAKPAKALQRNLFLLPCPGGKRMDRCQLPHKWESAEVRTSVEQSYQAVLATVIVKQPRNVTGAGER